VTFYRTPADIDDLKGRPHHDKFVAAWGAWIEKQIRDEIANIKSPPPQEDGSHDVGVPHPLFFAEADHPADATDLAVTWNAFPLFVTRQFKNDPEASWRFLDQLGTTTIYTPDGAADVETSYRPQDEYCEWHRYDDGPLGQRIVFTAEGPEYWIQLAAFDFDHVVDLYRTYVSPDVQPDDLRLKHDINFGEWVLRAGHYDPFNVWNTSKGVMHLTHRANTLGAEVNLAARATVLRRDAFGKRITEARRLISASGYGDANRSSDPSIGHGVNLTAVPDGAAAPLSITLANPVGLYMQSVAEGRITDANDQPLVGWFTFVRGKQGRGLMAVLKPPAGDNRTLDDVYVDGKKLQSGAQVAHCIQMVIYAATAQLNTPMPSLIPPFYRSCVPNGTDVSDLTSVNLLDGFSAAASCQVQGKRLQHPLDLIEAFPDLEQAPGSPLAVSGSRLRMTRNG
jgi:hypothetical protein